MDRAESEPISLGPLLEAELTEIGTKRTAQGTRFNRGSVRPPKAARKTATQGSASSRPAWQTSDEGNEWVKTIAKAHEANLVGLAFSGGGIRSATFNLGVLQGLADLGLLHRFDYLSTVSGGGYIGGWLAAWIKRTGSFAEVQKRLAAQRVHQEGDNEPAEIRFLRVFSNYLTPKVGFFSADTWAAAAIILRNILLNLSVLLASLVALLLVPRAAMQGGSLLQTLMSKDEMWVSFALVLFLFVPLGVTMINMVYVDAKTRSEWTKQGMILILVAGPLFASAIFAALWQTKQFGVWYRAMLYGAGAYEVIMLTATIFGVIAWLSRARPKKLEEESAAVKTNVQEKVLAPWDVPETLVMLAAALPAGALGGWLYGVLSRLIDAWGVQARLTFGAPLALGILLLAATLHIGVMGTVFPDRRREWCGRLVGWLLLAGTCWFALLWVALYFPYFVSHLPMWALTLAKKYLTPAWIVSTAAGVLAGKGNASGKPGELNWKDWLAKAAPYIFVVGLVCWVSWGTDQVLDKYHHLYSALAGCGFVAAFMAWRVDINQFSMHQMYRNRLVNCYLGASNTKRAPNRFTGLDKTDDLALKDLKYDQGYDGPYPVLNSALNLVKGQDLAWQERKAESFVMTPLHCGYDVWLEDQDSPMLRGERDTKPRAAQRGLCENLQRFGYRKTEEYAFPPPRGKGLYLGTALGISGAAASPNMGFYTSAPVAFLMTVFNVRLGQWLGNPRHVRTWKRPTPRWGLTYLLNELFAGTTDDAAYVYLSDGGHFDNMGLYELVKRRCGLIIVCDAEADSQYQYRGLAGAIRKCRIDMGIDINLDLTELTPPEVGKPSTKHCAIGTIHYENADIEAPAGTIIYIKASLTGDEPADVQNYKKTRGAFPHESTVDQWFSESQFESYRQLGYHEVLSSIQGTLPVDGPGSAPPHWWSTAAAAVSEVLSGLASGSSREKTAPSSEKPTLDQALGKILDNFGFHIADLQSAMTGTPKTVHPKADSENQNLDGA
jgi:patatin-like phospholipase